MVDLMIRHAKLRLKPGVISFKASVAGGGKFVKASLKLEEIGV
jgi:hypothetical protein